MDHWTPSIRESPTHIIPTLTFQQLFADGRKSFESFILLTPCALAIPTVCTRIELGPEVEPLGQGHRAARITTTHHIELYSFPPLSTLADVPEDSSPPFRPVHVTTINLPGFGSERGALAAPPRLSIRADPPPRHTFPTHPVGNPARFVPTPESGLVVVEVHSQTLEFHYVLCILKSTLLQYLPPLSTSQLDFSDAPPVLSIEWDDIAPYVRLFGPEEEPSGK